MEEVKITGEFKISNPELSEWKCYMFGNKPGGNGMAYQPQKHNEPNWFVRWMMKICFACTWVKDESCQN